jgi:hypothetical protein
MTAHYVALGDSISIDDYAGGIGRGGASLLFRNRDDDFPDWRGRDLVSRNPDATYDLLATDGATTRTLLEIQLPRLQRMKVRPTLVTLTIGGNDLLQAYGDTTGAREVVARVRTAVARAVAEIAQTMDTHGIVVGTVYDPSDGTGDTTQLGLPPWPDGVTVIAELNAALREVAQDNGCAVADIAEHFHGHGVLAGDPSSAQARPAARELWFCNVIEPNAWGASGLRAAFYSALNG